MPRPQCCRRVLGRPGATCFRPSDHAPPHEDAVALTLDELEALRLADLEGLYQENAAERMRVSRATFGRIIDAARRKVAEALVHGKVLRIEGGVISTDPAPALPIEDTRRETRECPCNDAVAASSPVGSSASQLPIFVYGTLLRGGTNHELLRDARFLGRAKTRPEFTLYDLGAYPAMVAGGATVVHGEIYEVGPDTLLRLDELEEHPTYYRRTAVALDGGVSVETYLLAPEQVTRDVTLELGRWPLRRPCPRTTKVSSVPDAKTLRG